jgi:hypothetical protein
MERQIHTRVRQSSAVTSRGRAHRASSEYAGCKLLPFAAFNVNFFANYFNSCKLLGAALWIPYILARFGHTHHHHPLAAACFAGVQPVVGFVSVTQPSVRKADAQHNLLAERATEWLRLLNTRQLRDLDSLLAEDATCHVCPGLLLAYNFSETKAAIQRDAFTLHHVIELPGGSNRMQQRGFNAFGGGVQQVVLQRQQLCIRLPCTPGCLRHLFRHTNRAC